MQTSSLGVEVTGYMIAQYLSEHRALVHDKLIMINADAGLKKEIISREKILICMYNKEAAKVRGLYM